MRSLAILSTAFAIISAVSATITVTTPSSDDYWVLNSTNAVSWNSSGGDPDLFSVLVLSQDQSRNASFTGGLAVLNNVRTTNNSVPIPNINLPTGDGFILRLINVTNITQVYAESEAFSIRPAGTITASASSVQANPSSSTSGSSPSSSGSSSGAQSLSVSLLGLANGDISKGAAMAIVGAIGFGALI